MAHQPKSSQRFNHVAMSVPASALDPGGRAAITDFYRDVFGWVEIEDMTKDGEQLVLLAHAMDQFVFLIAEDEPMTAPALDHFGLAVDTTDELEALLERCRAYRERDDRVEIIDPAIEDHGPVRITSFYVRFLFPLMIEVQHFEVADEARQPTARA